MLFCVRLWKHRISTKQSRFYGLSSCKALLSMVFGYYSSHAACTHATKRLLIRAADCIYVEQGIARHRVRECGSRFG